VKFEETENESGQTVHNKVKQYTSTCFQWHEPSLGSLHIADKFFCCRGWLKNTPRHFALEDNSKREMHRFETTIVDLLVEVSKGAKRSYIIYW